MGGPKFWSGALIASGALTMPTISSAAPPTPAQTYADSTAFLTTTEIFPSLPLPFPNGRGPLETAVELVFAVVQAGVCDEIEASFDAAEQAVFEKDIDLEDVDIDIFIAREDLDNALEEIADPTQRARAIIAFNQDIDRLTRQQEALTAERDELAADVASIREANENCAQTRAARAGTTISSKGARPINSQFGSFGDAKLQFHFGGTISSVDDNRAFADRDATTQTGFVGVSKQVNAQTSVGAQLSFSQSEVSSVALDSTLDSDFFGITAFAAHQLSQNVALSGFVGYAHGTNDLDLNGALGRFDTDVFSVGAQIQGRYNLDGFTISPDASVTFSQVNNDSFLASNGVATNAKSLTLGAFSAGGSVSKSFVANDGSLITASLGLHGVYSTQSDNSLDLINGATIGETGFGVKLTPSLNIAMANGGTLSLSGNYSQYSDASDWSLGASLNIPLR